MNSLETITMNDVLTPAARPVVRATAASLPTLVGIEMRKSLSTRSGKALAAATVVLPASAMAVATLGGAGAIGAAAGPIAAIGIFAALLLLAIGVLSTAGEWTHGSVQTTFLLVPHRGRVLTAKAVAVALLGAVLAALSTAAATAVLALALGSALTWGGALLAMGTVVAAGAAFAVIGAGVGAMVANVPAALTSLYLVVLGVMPVLSTVQPKVAENLDPNGAILSLAQGQDSGRAAGILVGWVVVTTVAGTLLTRRRQVA